MAPFVFADDSLVAVYSSEDELHFEIVEQIANSIRFNAATVSHHAHICSMEEVATLRSDGSYVYEDKKCKVVISFNARELKVKINDECKDDYCGANVVWPDEVSTFQRVRIKKDYESLESLDFGSKSATALKKILSSNRFKNDRSKLSETQKQQLLQACLKFHEAGLAAFKSKKTKLALENLVVAAGIISERKLLLPTNVSLPKFAEIMNDFGFIFEKVGDGPQDNRFMTASRYYRDTISLDPTRIVAYLNLADIEWSIRQCSKCSYVQVSVENYYWEYLKRVDFKTLSPQVAKRIHERCPKCTKFKDLQTGGKPDPALIGRWELQSETCLNSEPVQVAAKPAKIIYDMDEEGRLKGELTTPGSDPGYWRWQSLWKTLEGKALVLRETPLQGWTSKEDAESKSPLQTKPMDDVLFSYRINTKSGRTLEIDEVESGGHCKKGPLRQVYVGK